jgi:hypothetical protein
MTHTSEASLAIKLLTYTRQELDWQSDSSQRVRHKTRGHSRGCIK